MTETNWFLITIVMAIIAIVFLILRNLFLKREIVDLRKNITGLNATKLELKGQIVNLEKNIDSLDETRLHLEHELEYGLENLDNKLESYLENLQFRNQIIFGAVIHNLKSCLIGIKMSASTEQLAPGSTKQYLNSIEKAAAKEIEYIKAMIKSCLENAALPQITSHPFSPYKTLEKISKRFKQDANYAYYSINIELPAEGAERVLNKMDSFRGNEAMLITIFDTLITNAFEALTKTKIYNKSVTVAIDLVTRESQEWLKFSISNAGQIPTELLNNFFKRPVISDKRDGSGVGVYYAAMLTGFLRGKINLVVRDTKRVNIELEFPVFR